jgi:hypothetical protein
MAHTELPFDKAARLDRSRRSSRPYYTLCELSDLKWSPQFGDYNQRVVQQERRDLIYAAEKPSSMKRCLRIIKSGDRQADINAAVYDMNYVPACALFQGSDAGWRSFVWLIAMEAEYQLWRQLLSGPSWSVDDTQDARLMWRTDQVGKKWRRCHDEWRYGDRIRVVDNPDNECYIGEVLDDAGDWKPHHYYAKLPHALRAMRLVAVRP